MSEFYPTFTVPMPPQKQEHEQESVRLGLAGEMAAFEGTPLAPIIEQSLTEAGIEPYGYDPTTYEHAHYHGLLTDTPDPRGNRQDNLTVSPIVTRLVEAVKAGHIHREKVDVHGRAFRLVDVLSQENPTRGDGKWLFGKIHTYTLEALKDSVSGEVLCYIVSMASDGGRPGKAILSTKHVVPKTQEL